MSARLPILTFHALDDGAAIVSLPPRVFERSLTRLADRGLRTMSLAQVLACIREDAPFPDRSVVITFDDGYESVYEVAFPVLRRLGMMATVFLTVGASGNEERLPSREGRVMLRWDQIREMHRHGIEFGAHTCTHPDLTRLSDDQIEAEVRDSRVILEQALGIPVPRFSYPYGRYDRRVRGIVKRHFDSACSDRLRLASRDSDPYALERVDTFYLRRERLLGLAATAWLPWYVRACAVPREARRAVRRLTRRG
jgi:peptidoglycan/xylan/chitin deacetylase (PgdA/CDA1 family)